MTDPSSAPPYPLWPRVVPSHRNLNTSANAARLLYYCAERLVVVLPEENDKPGTPADLYAVTPTGMLSWQEAEALIYEAADRYFDDCERVLGSNNREYDQCSAHATRMKNDGVPRAVRATMPAVAVGLQREGLLPPEVELRRKSEIDADLSCIGTPSGVLDLLDGRILTRDEARKRLVRSSTDVEYDQNARHEKIDDILPPIDANMAGNEKALYRAAILGYALTHVPSREFMWEICAADSGKSTFINALEQGLGLSYITEIRPEALRPDPRRSSTSHNDDLFRLAKPFRFAFVHEFEGEIDSGIIKSASGGDNLTGREIYTGSTIIHVTAHLWFMGNPRNDGGPQLGITNDDENTRAILGRVRMLQREPVPNPDPDVVNLDTPEFGRAALARLVEYTKACHGALSRFPPDPPSSKLPLARQQQAEAEDWQRDWLPNVIRARAGGEPEPDACVTSVYDNFKEWWGRHGTGTRPKQPQVTRAVNRHYVEARGGRCPRHGNKNENIYHGYVIVPLPPVPLVF